MKLLKKYRTYTYTSLVMAIIIGFISNYHLFKHFHLRTADEIIKEYRTNIEDYAIEHKTLTPLMQVNSKIGYISRMDSTANLSSIDDRIKDTLAYDHYQDEIIIFRKMIFPLKTEDGTYLVQLMLPTLELDYFIGTLALSLLIFTGIFIFFTSLADQLFTRKIFKPFHKILQMIKSYNIEENSNLKPERYDIDEFKELSSILNEMTNKINNVYYEMKEFLEYTSHEIQTPLSVIQLKVETLNQKNLEDEDVLNAISSIQASLRKVIRFNRSILFIAKIQNGQYSEGKSINLRKLIQNYAKQYEELLSMKGLNITITSKDDFRLTIHPILAEHLVQNILTNAIKHNYYGGSIEIVSYKDKLEVSNTFNESIAEGDLFEKYNHTREKCDSSGLGLAMVKAICMKNNIDTQYTVEGHKFIITFQI